ncbi:hypothetical protein PAMP_001645 [Pampus punctatissimus]
MASALRDRWDFLFLQSSLRHSGRSCLLACWCLSEYVGVCVYAGVYASLCVNMFV